MAGKIVSFTSHKSQIDRRRAKKIVALAREDLRDAQKIFGTRLAGYALIVWCHDRDGKASWRNESPVPIEIQAMRILNRQIAMSDAEQVIDSRFGFREDD